MKNWITNVVFGQIFQSKKFIYALTALIVPYLGSRFGWTPEVAESVWHTFLVLIVGQGIADISKKK